MSDLHPEDEKIVTLARAARARTQAAAGAAVRDADGRTYSASTVTLPSMRLSALQAVVALAVSSGARSLEAAALVGSGPADDAGLAALRDLGGPGVPVLCAGLDGVVVETLRT